MLDVYTDLYEWKGIDRNGVSVIYQTAAPQGITEAGMLEHLKGSYRNLTITYLRRIGVGEMKPPTGIVQRHAFDFGIIEDIERMLRPETRLRLGKSLLEFQGLVRKGKKRSAVELGVEITKEYEAAVAAARAAESKAGRSLLGAGRSLLRSA